MSKRIWENSSYGTLERLLAKSLDSSPKIRLFLKRLYIRLNYYLYGEKGFFFRLKDDTRLISIGSKQRSMFFGYYNFCPWNKPIDSFLCNRIASSGGLYLEKYDLSFSKAIALGHSMAWNYQQGSMLQWFRWGNEEIPVFNVIENDLLGSKLYGISQNLSFCPWPIQAAHPLKEKFLSLNYLRLNRLRPEYGYNVKVKNFAEDFADSQDGLWQIAWPGQVEWFLSLEDLKSNVPRNEMIDSEHKVNHAMYSPSGKRIVFMHRWIGPAGKFSRLYSLNEDGSNLQLLLDNRMISHYNWRNDEELIAWARNDDGRDHYLLLNAVTGEKKILGDGVFNVFGDGHPSFSPCGRYVVTDTYPDRKRQRSLLLFDLQNVTVTVLGRFLEPLNFDGPNRCDLHPRWSPDGRKVSFDSVFSGKRNSYILNLDDPSSESSL